jgi:hypothetical protein
VTKTNALESLVIAGFVRGLSVRDVEATLADALGAEAALSKSTVSRVCEAIKDEFDRWSARRLDEVELDYLFLDGSCFKMHPGARAEPVLAAWGITTEGKPVFLGLAPGGSESTDAWSVFLEELKGRGLRSPLLIISDGAGGLINAAETSFARSLRQRCLIHRARNLLAKVPAHAQGEVKAAYWQVFDTDDVDLKPGPQLVALVQARIDTFAEHYRPSYPLGSQVPAWRPRAAHRLPALPGRAPQKDPPLQPHRAHLRGDPPTREGHRPTARRSQRPLAGVGGARPREPRLARVHHDRKRAAPAAGSASRAARLTHSPATRHTHDQPGEHRNCRSRRLTCPCVRTSVRPFTPSLGRHRCAPRSTRPSLLSHRARRMPPDHPGPPPKFHSERDILLGFKGSSQHCLLLTGSTVARRGPRRVFSSRGSCGVGG